MQLGARIRDARERKGLSQTRLAQMLGGLTRSAVSQWESGLTYPATAHLVRLPELLGIDISDLISGDDDVQTVPLVSWVRAGQLDAPPPVEDIADMPKIRVAGLGPGRWIALRIEGNSMDRIVPSDAVIVANLADRELVSGKNYVVRNDEGTTFKRYRARPDRFEPMSSDMSHEPIFPDESLKVVARVKLAIIEL